ncbi:hypothetical protein C9J01_01855 [Photobacterium rosenbergii]|uniref:DUF2860 domain-containing protein n=1 Tax=Photobacterium rosenbergii TaxID=294936 RepID=A0A2T3NJU5_9GAMM|nr:DUF2860 family protein [Photobacterium rosenbergii]PSW15785.1 hypothetical protein C9J01_01855 [Photobacterium rosenbergii]
MFKLTLFAASIVIVSSQAYADRLLPTPKRPGLSGNVGFGAAFFDVESNFIAGNRFVDLDNETTRSLSEGPSSDSTFSPDIQLDLRYTFDNNRTQIFFGNALTDLVRLDFSQQLGIRHYHSRFGTLSAGYVFSAVPTEVWTDPFEAGSERSRTDRDSNGFKLAFDDIAGVPVGVNYTFRKIDIDNEASGTALLRDGELSPADIALLDREGDLHRLEIIGLYEISHKHKVAPQLTYSNLDADGGAASSDVYNGQLSYLYTRDNLSWVATAFVAQRNYDKANPIYNEKPDTTGVGISTSLLAHDIIPYKNWSILAGLSWIHGDSDIEFYDSEILAGNLSVIYFINPN